MVPFCKKLTESNAFHYAILVVILVNSLVVGIETDNDVQQAHGATLHLLDLLILWVFIGELLLRLIAHVPAVERFFLDGWNVFDFAVVAVALLPAIGPWATVARLARVLRVARLVEFSPKLRLIVDTMLRSIPSMGHVLLLMGLLLYVYSVLGMHWFQQADPENWSSLGSALWVMFQTLTFENWVALQKPVTDRYPLAWVFFFTFIVLAVFMGLNLFIAVIMNNLGEVKAEHAAEAAAKQSTMSLKDRIQLLKAQLEDLEAAVDAEAAAKK